MVGQRVGFSVSVLMGMYVTMTGVIESTNADCTFNIRTDLGVLFENIESRFVHSL